MYHVFFLSFPIPGFLETNDGCILKPLQSPPRGTREGEFYKRVFAAGVTDGVTLQLRGLLPVYLGEFSSQAMPNGRNNMEENVVMLLPP